MTGSHPAKYELEDAHVYIHIKDESSGANVTHVDIEHPELNQIIKPSEKSFVGGKDGGVFIGLKAEMIERAEEYVQRRE